MARAQKSKTPEPAYINPEPRAMRRSSQYLEIVKHEKNKYHGELDKFSSMN